MYPSSYGEVDRRETEYIRELQAEVKGLRAELASRPMDNYRYDHCFGKDGGIPTLYVPGTARWFVKETK